MIATSLENGIALHRAGRTAAAAEIYRQMLEETPGHPDALHLLGLIESDAGRHDEAVALIRRAVRGRPNSAAFRANLGLALSRAGRYEEAVEAYRHSLGLDPGHAPTLAKLGRALAASERNEEACAALEQAVARTPDDTATLNALGVVEVALGKHAESRERFRKALVLDPDFEEARRNLANLCRLAGGVATESRDWTGAAGWFTELVSLEPDAESHFRLAFALAADHRLEEAAATYRKALETRPGHAETLNNLAHVELALGRSEEALERLREAIQAAPEYRAARYNLAVTLQAVGRTEEAEGIYRDLVAHDAGDADSWNNLGGIELARNRVEEAMELYHRALDAAPEHIDARWNLGLANLATGVYAAGWLGYEARLEQPHFPRRDFAQPMWYGEPLEDRTLLVWAEQGLGDAIQFARFLPAVAGRVRFECQPALAPLFAASSELAAIPTAARGGDPGEFDVHLPLLSLPHLLGARVDSLPAPLVFDRIEEARIGKWRDRAAERAAGALRVGVVWAGNPANRKGSSRSMSWREMARLAEVEGVKLFGLQRGPQAAEAEGDPRLLAFDGEGLDIADTAAMMMAMDLVITVDTMAAHLAGSLGRPTWTLLPFAADWRWMLDRADSPWYPSMRLFRQPVAGNWESVVEMGKVALAEAVRRRS